MCDLVYLITNQVKWEAHRPPPAGRFRNLLRSDYFRPLRPRRAMTISWLRGHLKGQAAIPIELNCRISVSFSDRAYVLCTLQLPSCVVTGHAGTISSRTHPIRLCTVRQGWSRLPLVKAFSGNSGLIPGFYKPL